jgi:cytoskeleton protein RodZ
MALKPEVYFGVTDHKTIEISQESFRSVLGQIEAELLCSDTYSHALASLQAMLGEAASAAEILIRAVSREAVKLAFQRLPKQNKTELQGSEERFATGISAAVAVTELQPPLPATDLSVARISAAEAVTELQPPLPAPIFYQRSATLTSPTEIKSDTENSDRNINTLEERKQPLKDESQVELATPLPIVVPAKSFPGIPFLNRQKKLTKEEQAAIAIQQRKDCLCELGKELRKGRQIRSLSLQQLHSQTLVPLHHIESIENGEIEKLPQDIYLRGFIRRLGDALGLDGSAMAEALPKLESSQTMNPYLSISDSESDSEFQMHPVHLYIGYTALMAGAVGGLAWLSQQPVVPGGQTLPQTQMIPPSVTPSQNRQAPVHQPGLKLSSSNGGMIVGTDMAPPEVIFG